MHRTRDLLVKQRTQLINMIRGLMAEFGVDIPKGWSGRCCWRDRSSKVMHLRCHLKLPRSSARCHSRRSIPTFGSARLIEIWSFGCVATMSRFRAAIIRPAHTS